MAKVKHATSVQGADEPGKSVQALQWNENHFLSGVADQASLDAEISNRQSADNALSAAMAALGLNDLSGLSLSSPASIADGAVIKWSSAQQQWIEGTDNTGGAGGSVTSDELSIAVAAETSNRISADNSIISRVSALSAFITAESAARIAADNALSNAISVLSTAHTSGINRLSNEESVRAAADNALSNALSALSTAHTSGINRISNEESVRAAGDSALSNRIDSVHSVLSQRLSALSLGGLKGNSIASPTSGQVLKYNSAAGQWVNSADETGGAGGGSVTSAELSAASAAALSALSHRAPWLAASIYVIGNTQSINVSTVNTNISGLSFSVAANETWRFEGVIMFSTSAATVGVKYGASIPPASTPRAFQARGTGIFDAGNLAVSGVSAPVSLTSAEAGIAIMHQINALINFTSGGIVQFVAAGIASTAQSPIHILSGSYMKAFRVK